MYVIMAFDKPDSQALRLENRAEHVAYVLAQDGVKTAGPFTSDDGDTMIGTLLLLDVATRQEAQACASWRVATSSSNKVPIMVSPSSLVNGPAVFTPSCANT